MLLNRRSLIKTALSMLLVIIMVISCSAGVFAGTRYFNENSITYRMESLDRGLVGAKTANGVFLSWRLFKDEVTGYSSTGLTGANFNLYRDGTKIATITDSTNYLDAEGLVTSRYYVCSVVNGVEVDKSATITPYENSYFDIPLIQPAGYTTKPGNLYPDGEAITYSPNDMSIGDVDSDGQYEYFVKWDPSNAKDVIQQGYTGVQYLDCYKMDGTLLYRIDLGLNIRSGAHYTQFLVYDFDGDGKCEIILKTAPGTSVYKLKADGSVDESTRKYITLLPEDVAAGYSNSDDYRCDFKQYYDYLVNLFKNWQSHPEVVNGHWPDTLQECFGITTTSSGIIGGNFDSAGNATATTSACIGADLLSYTYPLSDEHARNLVDYFLNTFVHTAPKDTRTSASTYSGYQYNNMKYFEGYIFTGPEYLTVFEGATGKELETIRYKPGRDDDGLMWGDYAMSRIEPCNRVDRMQAEVAYLDGQKPYAVFGRGYYTRTTLVSYSWDGRHLNEYWYVDSGYPVMPNPFNCGPHGMDGRIAEYKDITTQGAHTMCDADVDGDGCDELILGSATIDHDGTVLYSSFDTISQGPNAGTYTRLGHGDSIHVTDIIPDRPGQEIFMCHEGGSWAPYGISMRDAKTGQVIWGTYRDRDNGRCMIGDIDPTKPGIENWSMALRKGDEAGTLISSSMPGTNANIKWAADMTTQVIDGSITSTPAIKNWDYTSNKVSSTDILTCTGTYTNNYTKGNPCLVADIIGDYREELILRSTAGNSVRVYFNPEVSTHKLFTLMDDRQYRTGVARQNDGYNQPAYTSFYYASDINWQTLYNSLGIVADKTVLNRLVTEAQAVGEDSVTPATWAILQQKLADALAVQADADATKQQVDSAAAALKSALDGLVRDAKVTLTGSAIVKPDSDFTVGVSLEGMIKDIYAEDITIDYSKELFDFIEAEPAAGSKVQIANMTTEGALRITAINEGGITWDASILSLKFHSKDTESLTPGAIKVTGAKLGSPLPLPKGTVVNAVGGSLDVAVLGDYAAVQDVSIDQGDAKSLVEGEGTTLTATITPANATNKTLIWSSNNTAVASVNASTGEVTANAPGTAVIKVQAADGASDTITITVTAKKIPATGITLNASSLKLKVGETATLTADVTPAGSTSALIWSSDNTTAAVVDASGRITAKAAGTATITVVSGDNPEVKATCTVTVYAECDLNNDGTIDVGDLAIAAYYFNAKEGDASWNDARIADIDGSKKVDILDLAIIAKSIQ